jgi:hypothetical protein
VADQLVALGIPPENFAPSDYRLTRPYATYQLRRVTHMVAGLRGVLSPKERLLVLDDGGYFLEAAAWFADELPRVCVVEQTRRGIRKVLADAACRRYAESACFVNVAEAPPKHNV